MPIPEWAQAGRAKWTHRGQTRPDFAIAPGPGQESVWDYPRPPRIEPDAREVIVRADAIEIARSKRTMRVLETAGPPVFYLPPEDIKQEYLVPAPGASLCEWKGEARYWSVRTDVRIYTRVGWSYPDPFPEYRALAGYISFYPAQLDCSAGGVTVLPQPGGFYGGWVTPEIVGPFKGEPGSEGW